MGERRIIKGWIYERGADGQIVPVGPATQQGIPPNPIKVQGAQLENTGRVLQNQQTQVNTAAKSSELPYIPRKAAADVRLTEANAVKAERDASILSDDQRKATMQGANLDALIGQINRTQELYNKSQAGGPGLGSLMEYLPLPQNKQFDTAGAGLAEQGLAAFRVPGVGSQSDAELRQFVEANKPSSWAQDSQNTERLRQMRMRVESTRKALGMPSPRWEGVPGGQIGNDPANAIAAERAKLEQSLANLPAAARAIGMRKFDADPRVSRHTKQSGGNVIDFNDLP